MAALCLTITCTLPIVASNRGMVYRIGDASLPNDSVVLVESSDSSSQASRMLGIDTSSKSSHRMKKIPDESFRFSVGPIWTVSKVYPENDRDYETDLKGTCFGVSVSNLWGGWYGAGLDFYGGYTRFESTDHIRLKTKEYGRGI